MKSGQGCHVWGVLYLGNCQVQHKIWPRKKSFGDLAGHELIRNIQASIREAIKHIDSNFKKETIKKRKY
jgi:hypothetical protein